MRSILFLLLITFSVNGIASGMYGHRNYELIIEDIEGRPLADTFLDYIIDGKQKQTKTDAFGKIIIPIDCGTECMSPAGPLRRAFTRNPVKYYVKDITIQYLAFSGVIKKNWKKYFKGKKRKVDHFCFETGKLID